MRSSMPERTPTPIISIPDIRVGFTLPEKRPVQWIVRRGETRTSSQAVNRFFHVEDELR